MAPKKLDPTGTDRIRRFLRDRPHGASSGDIARHVLHLRDSGSAAHERIVCAILRDDDRVFLDDTGNWRLRPAAAGESARFTVAAVRLGPGGRNLAAVSLQSIGDEGCGERFDRLCSAPEDWDAARQEAAAFLESSVLVTFDQHRTARLIERFLGGLCPPGGLPRLSIQRLGKRLLGLPRHPSLQELCDRFGVAVGEEGDLSALVDTLAELFEHIRDGARARGLVQLRELLEAQKRRPLPIDFSRYAFTPAFLKDLPRRPGVYVMRDREGGILYVGKTGNLRSRVGSYFRDSEERSPKISRLLDRLYHLECIPVGSDLEAVLVEARRIRSGDPEVNVQRRTHSGSARRRTEENSIAVLPSAEPRCAECFLFAAGKPLRQVRLSRSLEGFGAVRRLLEEFYFRPGQPAPLRADEEEEIELARRYIARHRDAISRINVDHFSGIADLGARLKEEIRSLAATA